MTAAMTPIEYVKITRERLWSERHGNGVLDVQIGEMIESHGLLKGEVKINFQHVLDEMLFPPLHA